jgi:hypothetical protein
MVDGPMLDKVGLSALCRKVGGGAADLLSSCSIIGAFAVAGHVNPRGVIALVIVAQVSMLGDLKLQWRRQEHEHSMQRSCQAMQLMNQLEHLKIAEATRTNPENEHLRALLVVFGSTYLDPAASSSHDSRRGNERSGDEAEVTK